MKLTDHTLVLSDQLFDVDTLVVDDAQIREVCSEEKPPGSFMRESVVSMNFAVLESGPFRKDRMSVWNWAGRCDDEGFCEDISQKPGINRRSRENAGKTVCDSDRIEQSILRGVFTTGKKSVRCKNPALFCYLQKKNSRG